MIPKQVLQTVVDGMKSITRKDISVADLEGQIVASTESDPISHIGENMESIINSKADSQQIKDRFYFKIITGGMPEYVLIISGEDEEAYRIGKITAFQITNLLLAYKERYDKESFIKNLLLDNMLLVDINNGAKKLGIENSVRRIVFLIEIDIDIEMNVVEIIRNLFPAKNKDFVTTVDEKSIILVKQLKNSENTPEQLAKEKKYLEDLAQNVSDILSTEAMSKAYIAIGTVVSDLKNVSLSYKEARVAMEVGKIFKTGSNIVKYDELGVGRLIYQLPYQLCEMYINEVLQGCSIDSIDDDIMASAESMFENSLVVSEAARKLYVHRNTLVYRLDKLMRMTGLDIRKFDDAATFMITMMVAKYMTYKDMNEY